MRRHAYLSLLLLAAATACASVTDGPTAPLTRLDTHTDGEVTYEDDGEPPPPPIDTGGTMQVDESSFQFNARYFENTQNMNTWVVFQSTGSGADAVIASPNARLMYNAHTLRTKGVGTLTYRTSVIALSLVKITTPGGFACPTPTGVTPQSTTDGPTCGRGVQFTYGSDLTNTLFLHPRRGEVSIP